MLVGIDIMAKLLLRYSFILILKKITVGFLRGLGPPWSARWAWGSSPVMKIKSLVRDLWGTQKTMH